MRSSTVAADQVVRRALAAYLVDGAAPQSGHYSVILGPTVEARAGERPLSVLFADCVAVVRSRSPERVVRALAAYLAGHGAAEPPPALLRLDALVAVGPGRAVLLPRGALQHFDFGGLERGLGRLGVRLVDRPYAEIDPESGEVVVPPPPLDIDGAALDGLGPPAEAVAPGRYPLVAWGVARTTEEAAEPTVAAAAAHGVTLVVGRPAERAAATLEEMARLATSCVLVDFSASSLPDTLGALSRALGAG